MPDWRQLGDRRLGDVDADDGKVAVVELPNVGTSVATGAFCAVGVRVGADAFCEHTNT